MKRYQLLFITILGLLICQLTFAGYGNMIRIQNNSDKTLPIIIAPNCMSNAGQWPFYIAPHATSPYIYTETQYYCREGDSEIIVQFDSNFTTWADVLFSEQNISLGRSSRNINIHYDGVKSHNWDYSTLVVEPSN